MASSRHTLLNKELIELMIETTLPNESIENVLAMRYASPAMRALWSPRNKIIAERRFWIVVLEGQAELGVPTPAGAVAAYRRVVDHVDFASILAREAITLQDVKARLEEFNALAGFEAAHRGMTSRDLTDNVEQWQLRQSMLIVRDKMVAALARIAARASDYLTLVLCGRSHDVPGQATTLAKRFANFGQELLLAFERLESLIERYPLRGLKGAMGTAQDMLDLLEGDHQKLARLERAVAEHLGFTRVLDCVGQIYPRSLDFEVVSALAQAGAGPASFATTLRLMAGHELMTEGFKAGQSGSTAMPHKQNSRTCERITGMNALLQGQVATIGHLSGGQWQEGDVSCSIVRRVILPDSCFTADGLFESFLTVLAECGPFPSMIAQELDRYLPFLATTKILMAAVKRGVGREVAHAVIKEHAVEVARAQRWGESANDLYARLGRDERLQLSEGEIRQLVGEPVTFIGDAGGQVERFCATVEPIVGRYPVAATYTPNPIL